MVKRLLLRLAQFVIGGMIGIILVELVFQMNPRLLLRGMAVPMPVDPPLTTLEYSVYTSDADIFYWHGSLIRPIPTAEDSLEAQVTFQTDEWGFPNAGPVAPKVDVVILGRSYSLGAQTAEPWGQQLSDLTGYQVLNLSQTGSGIETKLSYFEHFGRLRNPQWVIIEVLPSMDILAYAPATPILVSQLPVPIIRAIWDKTHEARSPEVGEALYPLTFDLPGFSTQQTFFSIYLSALTLTQDEVKLSQQWTAFTAHLIQMVDLVHQNSGCVALLYVPTKENILIPLATSPESLKSLLGQITPWYMDETGNLMQDSTLSTSIEALSSNANDMRDLLVEFANEHELPFIDPTEPFQQAVLHGQSPYMKYDTHWSFLGHQIVAQMTTDLLQQTTCP